MKSEKKQVLGKPKLFLSPYQLGHHINITSSQKTKQNVSTTLIKTCPCSIDTPNTDINTVIQTGEQTRWLTSLLPCGWKLWELPTSSAGHGGTGGTGLDWSTTRMRPIWEKVVDTGVRHKLELMVDAGPGHVAPTSQSEKTKRFFWVFLDCRHLSD